MVTPIRTGGKVKGGNITQVRIKVGKIKGKEEIRVETLHITLTGATLTLRFHLKEMGLTDHHLHRE
nr:hypothetical protein Itr_chr01CG07070 [Ipomoea trifida]